jgi:hypothetical protein
MAHVDWHDTGKFVGRDLAERGGTAVLDNVEDIGLNAAKTWLDGVLDALHEQGIDARSIAISRDAFEDFTGVAESEGETYRGIVLLEVNDAGGRPTLAVAA